MKEVAEALYAAGISANGMVLGYTQGFGVAFLLIVVGMQYYKATFSSQFVMVDYMPILRAIIILLVLQLYGSLGGSVVSIVKGVGSIDTEFNAGTAFTTSHQEKLRSAFGKTVTNIYQAGKDSPNFFAGVTSVYNSISDDKFWDKNLTAGEIKAKHTEYMRKRNIKEREELEAQKLATKEAEADQGGIREQIAYRFEQLTQSITGLFSIINILSNWIKEGVVIMVRNVVAVVSLALLGLAFALGPIPIVLSILPAFKDAWQRWLSSLISFGLWGLTIKVLDLMTIGLAEYTYMSGMDDTNPVRAITVNLVICVLYIMTPKISNLMLGSGGEFYSAMTGGAAMIAAKTIATSQTVMGAATSSPTTLANGANSMKNAGNTIISNTTNTASSLGSKASNLANQVFQGSGNEKMASGLAGVMGNTIGATGGFAWGLAKVVLPKIRH
ncbi:MAG: hypothetical protein MUC49_22355 [Raineya sp.]|jgi:hypothetical protein|nr:hypothetical protein [Raineya sp.]